jgi:hypothetical protein
MPVSWKRQGLIGSDQRKRVAEMARLRRLPTMVHIGEMVRDGGLMTYAPNYPALFHRTARTGQDPEGGEACNLPVEQPTKSVMVVSRMLFHSTLPEHREMRATVREDSCHLA